MNQESEIGYRKSGNRKSEIRNQNLKIGHRKSDIGYRKSEIGNLYNSANIVVSVENRVIFTSFYEKKNQRQDTNKCNFVNRTMS